MKNKGRRQKAGYDSTMHGIANCKSLNVILTRPIESMSSNGQVGEISVNAKRGCKRLLKKSWGKRVRGYFKSQTKDILNEEY